MVIILVINVEYNRIVLEYRVYSSIIYIVSIMAYTDIKLLVIIGIRSTRREIESMLFI